MAILSDNVLSVLSASRTEGNALFLGEQLERKLYLSVVKVLDAAGGRWNRKAKAHLFEEEAADAIEPILLTGVVTNKKQEFGQFDTPPAIAELLAERCDIQHGHVCYEPSAGIGNLVEAAIKRTGTGVGVFGQEIDPSRHARCLSRHWRAFGAGGLGLGDFLAVTPNPVFDRVIMNPPFAKQADIDHVNHALKFVAPGGRLAAIMAAGVRFRQNRKADEFRALVEAKGTLESLPDGAFQESGTSVNAVIVTIQL